MSKKFKKFLFFLNEPNFITFLRFVFGFFMVFFSVIKKLELFLLFYGFAVITDVLDGFIARKYKKESHKGKIFDILADNFILICLFIGFFLFKKNYVLFYKTHLFFIVGYYFFVQIISIIFTKKLIFKRTILANVSAIIFPFLIFFLFVFDNSIFIFPYIIFMIFSLSEKLILALSNEDRATLFFVKNKKNIFFLFFIVLFMSLLFFLITYNNKNYNNLLCFENFKCIYVEVRNDDEGRRLGLMYKKNLSDNEGMLFIFDNEVNYPFWMKNMNFNIDIIFLNKDKKIVSIVRDAFPCNKKDEECELYYSKEPYWYVVEVVSGFSDKNNLLEGQLVYFD